MKEKIKRHYGKYCLIFVALGVIFQIIEQGIEPYSLSRPAALFVSILGPVFSFGFLYFLVLWITDKIRHRGGVERPESKTTKLIINGIFILLLIGLIASIFAAFYSKPSYYKEAGKLLKDVFYGTETAGPESEKYIKIISEIYEPIKEGYAELIENSKSIDLSDLFEYSSFQNLERMRAIVSDSNFLMENIDRYINMINEVRGGTKEIASKYLAGEELEAFTRGVEESSSAMVSVSQRYVQAIKDYFNKLLAFYEFLIINFDYYEIDYDETGEQNIFFVYENDVERYNKYMEEFTALAAQYTIKEEEYFKYMNDYLKDYGLDYEDFIQYLEK